MRKLDATCLKDECGYSRLCLPIRTSRHVKRGSGIRAVSKVNDKVGISSSNGFIDAFYQHYKCEMKEMKETLGKSIDTFINISLLGKQYFRYMAIEHCYIDF